MFSYKACVTPNPKQFFCLHTELTTMLWAKVLTRLTIVISWHINIFCVWIVPWSVFCQSMKNHNALIIVFLVTLLAISSIVQEKTRVWWAQNTPHSRQLRPQAKPFEGLHSFGSLWNVDLLACHDKLVLSDNSDVLKFKTTAVWMVIRRDRLCATWHSISISPPEIWDRHHPVVFTDERTLLNTAVVHPSVNMAFASQIVPLVDSGLGLKLYLAQGT